MSGGAQGGKTLLATMEALWGLLRNPTFEDIRGWVIGPQYKQCDKIFYRGIVRHLIHSEFRKELSLNKAERLLTLNDGSWIQGRSAENPQDLAAEELDFVIIDEGPRCKMDTFEFLLTRLIARKGWLLAIGTPVGRNWYHTEFLKGLTGDDEDTESFTMPTVVNPHISKIELQKLKDKMPERWYRQEVLGEFIEDASSVFQGVRKIVNPYLTFGIKKPGPHVIGVDLGRFNDYTVALAYNLLQKEVCGRLRLRGDWITQTNEIENFCRYWGGPVFIDATTGVSAGSYMHDMLKSKGIPAYGINIDRLFKETMIGRLQKAIIDASFQIPEDKIFISELEAFQFIRKRNSLTVKMEAPSGLHDDHVTALGLCIYASVNYSGQLGLDVR